MIDQPVGPLGRLDIKDAIAHSLQLQVECEGGGKDMSCIIPRNSPIPCSKWQFYVTGDDNQTLIEIPVYQGESDYSHENK